MQSQEIEIPHVFVDFAKRLELNDGATLILEDDMKHAGFIRNLNDRWYLYFLKEFLTSPMGNKIKRFNFEKNFYTAAMRNFERLIEIIENNQSIEILEIGNNVIPPQLMGKLADALAKHPNLIELSLRMHWFPTSQDNMAFIPIFTSVIPNLYKLERIDLSCNQIDMAGLTALTVACEQNNGLLEINLSGVTYVNISPTIAHDYWYRIQTALASNRALLAAMANIPTPKLPEQPSVPAAAAEAPSIKRKWLVDSDEDLQSVQQNPQQIIPNKHEVAKPQRRKLIELSDEEQASPSLKGSTIQSASFFKHKIYGAAPERKQTFTRRLSDIGIKIEDQKVFGIKAIELVYYEQIADKLYVRFMEEPAALFYKHGQHTYQKTYDHGYISRMLKQQKIDPFTHRTITEHVIVPDPFYKEWLEGFVKTLEQDNQQRSDSPTLNKGFMGGAVYGKSCI